MTSKSKANVKEVKGEALLRRPYAQTLRRWRVLRRLSQKELAEKAEVPKHVIGSLERSARPIDLEEIIKLCHALKVNSARFMDEVHGLIQREIQSLEGVRASRTEEGLEELPTRDQEARKALEFLVKKGTQLFKFIDAMANRGWSPPDDEPQGGRSGGKRVRPSRK